MSTNRNKKVLWLTTYQGPLISFQVITQALSVLGDARFLITRTVRDGVFTTMLFIKLHPDGAMHHLPPSFASFHTSTGPARMISSINPRGPSADMVQHVRENGDFCMNLNKEAMLRATRRLIHGPLIIHSSLDGSDSPVDPPRTRDALSASQLTVSHLADTISHLQDQVNQYEALSTQLCSFPSRESLPVDVERHLPGSLAKNLEGLQQLCLSYREEISVLQMENRQLQVTAAGLRESVEASKSRSEALEQARLSQRQFALHLQADKSLFCQAWEYESQRSSVLQLIVEEQRHELLMLTTPRLETRPLCSLLELLRSLHLDHLSFPDGPRPHWWDNVAQECSTRPDFVPDLMHQLTLALDALRIFSAPPPPSGYSRHYTDESDESDSASSITESSEVKRFNSTEYVRPPVQAPEPPPNPIESQTQVIRRLKSVVALQEKHSVDLQMVVLSQIVSMNRSALGPLWAHASTRPWRIDDLKLPAIVPGLKPIKTPELLPLPFLFLDDFLADLIASTSLPTGVRSKMLDKCDAFENFLLDASCPPPYILGHLYE